MKQKMRVIYLCIRRCSASLYTYQNKNLIFQHQSQSEIPLFGKKQQVLGLPSSFFLEGSPSGFTIGNRTGYNEPLLVAKCFSREIGSEREACLEAGQPRSFSENNFTRSYCSEVHSTGATNLPQDGKRTKSRGSQNSSKASNYIDTQAGVSSVPNSKTFDLSSLDSPNALTMSAKQLKRKKLLRKARTDLKSCALSRSIREAVQVVMKVNEELGDADAILLLDELLLHVSRGGPDEKGVCWLSVHDGFKIINEFQQIGLYPSRLGLEALLDGCAAQGDAVNAVGIMDIMRGLQLPPTVFTLVRLFRVAVSAEDENLGLSALQEMSPWDGGDVDVQLLIRVIMKPLVDAAAMPHMENAPETLPRLRQCAEELLERGVRVREEGRRDGWSVISSELWQDAEHGPGES